MDFEILYHDGIFEIKTSGDAEAEKFRNLMEALVTHEKWIPGSPFLVNHARLDAASLTDEDIKNIAKLSNIYRDQIGKSKCAHLLSRDLEYGLARMWQVYVEKEWDATEQLFKSRDEAIAWLSNTFSGHP